MLFVLPVPSAPLQPTPHENSVLCAVDQLEDEAMPRTLVCMPELIIVPLLLVEFANSGLNDLAFRATRAAREPASMGPNIVSLLRRVLPVCLSGVVGAPD
jgi:hypothetical protein